MKHWLHLPIDWQRPDVEESYDLYWDEAGQYGQMLPRPSAAQVAAFYEIEDYYTHEAAEPHLEKARGGLSYALRHLAWRSDRGCDATEAWWRAALGEPPGEILEIGCGNGFTLARLQSFGHRVVGVEPDEAARLRASERGLEIHPGTAETLPPAIDGRSFDAVLLMHVLEHCLDPARALANARALLRPGGRLIVEVPNNACLGASFFGETWYWLDVPRHLNFFTARSLSGMVAESRLRVEETLYCGYVRQFSPHWIEMQARIAALLGRRAPGKASYFRYLAATAMARPDRK